MRAKEFISESIKYVYRIDSNYIPDFEKNMKDYFHNKDFTISGRTDFKGSVGKVTGIYASDDTMFTAPYATGGSSGTSKTRYVAVYGPGQPIVYFNKNDANKLSKNRSWLTVFDARNFRKLPSGEYFSEHPGKPLKQTPINDPFQYLRDTGWEFRLVDNLQTVLKQIQVKQKNQIKQGVPEGERIRFGAEGMGYKGF